MNDALINELSSYKQSADSGDLRTAFWAVRDEELDLFEKQAEILLPPELRAFYERVGHGRIQLSRTGEWAEFDLNIIVDPGRLTSLFLRRDPSFEVDAELVEQGDLPFFDMGSHNYLVMKPSSSEQDAIYWPYTDNPICNNIWEFADRLLANPRFYHDT